MTDWAPTWPAIAPLNLDESTAITITGTTDPIAIGNGGDGILTIRCANGDVVQLATGETIDVDVCPATGRFLAVLGPGVNNPAVFRADAHPGAADHVAITGDLAIASESVQIEKAGDGPWRVRRLRAAAGIPMTAVSYSSGPGWSRVTDWPELWTAMFEALAYAINFQAAGQCWCGCTVQVCDYCAHECPR